MTNQVIIRKTVTETATFLDLPDQAIRQHLLATGFRYDSRTKQWYRSITDSMIGEARDVAMFKPIEQEVVATKQAA